MSKIARKLAQIACYALYEELVTYPKPGLVSHIDNGSHPDMNYDLFILSINSLVSYFEQIAVAGAGNQKFTILAELGVQAELQMFKATNNINTHRGTIFILGLLIAASAYCIKNRLNYNQIGPTLSLLYGDGLTMHQINKQSHGSIVRQKYQLESIVTAAIAGFPLVFKALAKFKVFLDNYNYADSKLLTFFYIMHHLDDTNLVYRGGIEALSFAKQKAGQIIISGELPYNTALLLHQEFIARNLSPGGSADVLAAVIFLAEVEKIWD